MIVRISTEGQYRLSSSHLDAVNQMDNELVDAIAEMDESTFDAKFNAMLEFIRSNGEAIGEDELVESTIILPYPEITVEEAREFFTGEGLFPNA